MDKINVALEILTESTESLESFVLSVLEEEDHKVYGYIARWSEQDPFWSLFMVSMDNDIMYCGGHYPLDIINMKDLTNILELFAKQQRKLVIDTEGYFGSDKNE